MIVPFRDNGFQLRLAGDLSIIYAFDQRSLVAVMSLKRRGLA
jgi:hypothetical protein